jgi:serine/threonine protein kinase
MKMLDIIDTLHRSEFIHGDIYEDNWMFTEDNKALKLIDFGRTIKSDQPRARWSDIKRILFILADLDGCNSENSPEILALLEAADVEPMNRLMDTMRAMLGKILTDSNETYTHSIIWY